MNNFPKYKLSTLANFTIALCIAVVVVCGCSFKWNKSHAESNETTHDRTIGNSEVRNSGEVQNSNDPTAEKPKQVANKVCGDPKKPCPDVEDKKFEDYELSFQLPAKLGNEVYRSEEFYAVVFYEIDPDELPCNEDLDGVRVVLEDHRKELQELYPENKIFVHHDCGGLGYVNYVVGENPMLKPFVGFYAGATKEEADKFFETVDESDGAKLVKMTVEYDNSVANE